MDLPRKNCTLARRMNSADLLAESALIKTRYCSTENSASFQDLRNECESYFEIMNDIQQSFIESETKVGSAGGANNIAFSNSQFIEKEISFFIENLRKVPQKKRYNL